MKLDGATVLLTGASAGIGAALAPRLARAGATVGLVGRRADRLDAVLDECRAHAPASRRWAVDLGDLDATDALAREAWDAFGHVDVLINNAAVPLRRDLRELTVDDVERTMRVNFESPVRLTMALLPRMLERERGMVVNVSSLGGRLGILHEAAYCASKFALCGWSESMAIDLYDTGIEVKLVLPGPIETEIWDLPDNDPALYEGPFVPAEECARSIIDAIEADGFEFYVPPEFPGGLGKQHDMVVGKTQDPDAFIDAMGQMARH